MTTSLKLLCAAVLLTLLSACNSLRTDNPIGASTEYGLDKRLIGAWRMVDPRRDDKIPDHGAGFMFLLPLKEGGLHGVIESWTFKAPRSDSLEFDVTPGMAGDNLFANVRRLSENGEASEPEPSDYLPFLYRFEADGTLSVWGWSDDGLNMIKDSIENGRLMGTVTIQSYGPDDQGQAMKPSIGISITADQKSLDAFFARNGRAIFTERKYSFRRIELP